MFSALAAGCLLALLFCLSCYLFVSSSLFWLCHPPNLRVCSFVFNLRPLYYQSFYSLCSLCLSSPCSFPLLFHAPSLYLSICPAALHCRHHCLCLPFLSTFLLLCLLPPRLFFSSCFGFFCLLLAIDSSSSYSSSYSNSYSYSSYSDSSALPLFTVLFFLRLLLLFCPVFFSS
jgi:hypothetical protein